ncbi:MAG: acyl-CoA dehydrogenase family protein [Acidimicrobiia bacterium]|nr:acyl-CoA dehydrogenase family protein [Acidimicrobiia bacterium]
MRFAFDDDQIDLRDAVRGLLADTCPPETVRTAWSNSTGRSDAAWGALADMGVVSMALPVDAGGLGLGALDWVLVLEETGRVALPEPVVETAVVGAPLLHALGCDVPAPPASIATLLDSGASLYADTAECLVVLDGDALRMVDPSTARLTAEVSVDRSRRLFAVEMAAGAGTVVATGPQARDAVAAARDRGALAAAAQLIGLAERMLATTVEYVSVRHQFGKPVGAQQALKHKLADVAVAIEFARPLVYRAAWSLDAGDPDSAVHVSMAKSQASDAAELAARHALQCHGAIGYSYECDLHLFMKRAWCLARSWGDARSHRDRVAAAVVDA